MTHTCVPENILYS